MKTANRKDIPVVYTIKGNRQCRSTLAFLEEHNIEYIEKNVNADGLNRESLLNLVQSVGGFDDIFAKRSLPYKELDKLMQDKNTRTSMIFDFILENPRVLKYPILFDNKRVMIGFNELDIRAFIPRKVKIQSFLSTLNNMREECPLI